jgi:hypothetical protein
MGHGTSWFYGLIYTAGTEASACHVISVTSIYGKHSWAIFARHSSTRPFHADQLNFDLWWRGLNITPIRTYLYNAAPPWDNALVTAFVHNTVTVDDRDQMTRAGRFLYLDWVNAYRKTLEAQETKVLQCVRGRYQQGNFRHTRLVSVAEADHWRVMDEIPLTVDSAQPHFPASLVITGLGMENRSRVMKIYCMSNPLGWITLQWG